MKSVKSDVFISRYYTNEFDALSTRVFEGNHRPNNPNGGDGMVIQQMTEEQI